MIELLNWFFSVHLMIATSATLAWLLRRFADQKKMLLPADEMKLHVGMMMLCLILPVLFLNLRSHYEFQPIVKNTAGAALRYDVQRADFVPSEVVLGKSEESLAIRMDVLFWFAGLLLLGGVVVSTWQMAREVRALLKVLQSSCLVRNLGNVKLAYSERVDIPFSVRTWSACWVILPHSVVEDFSRIKMSIHHELQHHRQLDTVLVYFFMLMRGLFGLNPGLSWWLRCISEVQELKVDQKLVDQGRIKPREYARCLVEVAESVVNAKRPPVCATGLVFWDDRHFIKRRIEFMFEKRSRNKMALLSLSIGICGVLTAVSVFAGTPLGTRVVSQLDAEKMAWIAQKNSDFPVAMNDLVLAEINRMVGSPAAREQFKQALLRMKTHEGILQRAVTLYQVPRELLAIPIVESRYQNLPPSANPNQSAGIWQFIPSTAWNFGLRVWDQVDDRLDIEKATDAAMRLLLSNRVRFKNWPLSILAYNSGEKIVSRGVLKLKTYDAWTLVRNGFEGDKNYLAKVMAAVIILKNPSVLD